MKKTLLLAASASSLMALHSLAVPIESVPDTGATAALLGVALVGLVMVRRMFR